MKTATKTDTVMRVYYICGVRKGRHYCGEKITKSGRFSAQQNLLHHLSRDHGLRMYRSMGLEPVAANG